MSARWRAEYHHHCNAFYSYRAFLNTWFTLPSSLCAFVTSHARLDCALGGMFDVCLPAVGFVSLSYVSSSGRPLHMCCKDVKLLA